MSAPSERLSALERQGLRRRLALAEGVDLSSNDVLGLSRSPAVAEAVREALDAGLPTGSTGSRLLSGHSSQWVGLEHRFAAWQGREASLYFGSGYAANIGLLAGLIEPGDIVLSDALNHACIIDGLRLSRGTVRIIPHLDLGAYEAALAQTGGGAWVVVESVYSMDGDCAPLERLARLTQRYGARLVVDEAHSTGLYGAQGAGRCSELPDELTPFASVHPCGKALGLSGGFVCADAETIELLLNTARSFIYSTAPTPMVIPALDAAVEQIRGLGAERARPLKLAHRFRQAIGSALDVGASQSHIVPVILGDLQRTERVAQALAARGWFARPLRPPTVPVGTARLRLVFRSDLTDEQVDRLAGDLLDVA